MARYGVSPCRHIAAGDAARSPHAFCEMQGGQDTTRSALRPMRSHADDAQAARRGAAAAVTPSASAHGQRKEAVGAGRGTTCKVASTAFTESLSSSPEQGRRRPRALLLWSARRKVHLSPRPKCIGMTAFIVAYPQTEAPGRSQPHAATSHCQTYAYGEEGTSAPAGRVPTGERAAMSQSGQPSSSHRLHTLFHVSVSRLILSST